MRSVLKLNLISYSELSGLVALSVLAASANASLLFLISRSIKFGGTEALTNGVLFFFALAVFMATQTILSHLLLRCSERSLSYIRIILCHLILRSRYDVIETLGRSRLWSTVTQDASILGQMWPNLTATLVSVITIVLLMIYLLVFAPLLFLIVILLMAGGVAVYSVEIRRARKLIHGARAKHDKLLDLINDMLLGIKELKLDHKSRAVLFLPRLEEESAVYLHENIDAQQRLQRTGIFGIGAFFMVLGVIAFLFPTLPGGDDRSQFAFLVVLIYLIGPISRVMGGMGILSAAVVSAQRVTSLCEILQTSADVACSLTDTVDGRLIAPSWRTISLNQVTYRYGTPGSSEAFALGPVSLTIKRGEIVFIVGANGSGKTTLAKVMTGLYYPSSGSISVDGAQIDAGNIDGYRQLFAAVFSDYHISEKLTEADSAVRGRLPQILLQLGFPDAVFLTRGRLEFSGLSRGQRGRVALALSRAQDKPIYLFDEWAAGQDPESRAHFYSEVLPILKREAKTVIVISHDDRYFGAADRVITLHGDSGTLHGDSGALEAASAPMSSESI